MQIIQGIRDLIDWVLVSMATSEQIAYGMISFAVLAILILGVLAFTDRKVRMIAVVGLGLALVASNVIASAIALLPS